MKKMASWEDYIKFEHTHKENVEKTLEFFKWVLKTYGKEVVDKEFENGLEIGTGLSGGYLPLLNIKNPVAVDYVYGPIKDKAEVLRFRNNTFDIVIISNTLDHCEDPRLAVKEMTRVLKDGGLLFIFNFYDEPDNHPWSFSNSKEILDLFIDFQTISFNEYPKRKRNAFMVATLQKCG